ncbi:hypothetical protein PFICI_05954 [Pestalotiopsis fici W106-1]|uniref:Uncharacterized protein n=1 Tax=Pestalotiopsis fici (strain W106-1 / CGMCC3.15140) TaxID=1229662 RepID=W3XDA1_PESFW|nr:uncharacterized protein PFICI_05954 [Pestalotiopsis fici W106-1]ETS84078.1 hypothetical protein PFICI_05954 [Pestalotiopsis fici W106-1]
MSSPMPQTPQMASHNPFHSLGDLAAKLASPLSIKTDARVVQPGVLPPTPIASPLPSMFDPRFQMPPAVFHYTGNIPESPIKDAVERYRLNAVFWQRSFMAMRSETSRTVRELQLRIEALEHRIFDTEITVMLGTGQPTVPNRVRSPITPIAMKNPAATPRPAV